MGESPTQYPACGTIPLQRALSSARFDAEVAVSSVALLQLGFGRHSCFHYHVALHQGNKGLIAERVEAIHQSHAHGFFVRWSSEWMKHERNRHR